MHDFQTERARQLAEEKLFEAKILASRPESRRVVAPSAHISGRAWLLIALAAVIVAAILLVTLL